MITWTQFNTHVKDYCSNLGSGDTVHVRKDTSTSVCACNACKRCFSSAGFLIRHLMGHEADEACQTQSGLYICSTCMKRYDTWTQFNTHVKDYCSNLGSGDTVHLAKDTTTSVCLVTHVKGISQVQIF